MRSLAQDLRHAVRLLRRSPGFTVVETLTRLLGIGATSANFSVVPRRPDKAVTVAQAQDVVWRVSAKLEAEQLADIFARDRELRVTRISQDHVGGSCQLRPSRSRS